MVLVGVETVNHGVWDIYWYCGGSLISESFVLTRAHCTHVPDTGNLEPTHIRLGGSNYYLIDDDVMTIDLLLIGIFVHPNSNRKAGPYDIASLRFRSQTNFTDHFRPICLKTHLNTPQNLIVVGWGAEWELGPMTPDLRSVDIELRNPNLCGGSQGYNNKMICAGSPYHGKGACHGDSGGPLQYISNPEGCSRVSIYKQVGIVSGGIMCARPETPITYTRVLAFIPWIESIVWR